MKTKKLFISLASALFLSAGISGNSVNTARAESTKEYQDMVGAETRARMGEQREDAIDAGATLQKSIGLYAAIVKGPHGQVPESILAKAQCVTVLPNVLTGAVFIGGTHGVGVTSCKQNNKWSEPAFVKLQSVSFGAQIGGKSSDIILFVLNEQAKAALKRGNFKLGVDASVVAGNFDKSFDASSYGVVAYNRTEGAFAGASITGGSLTSDDADTAAFYGKDVSYVSLLEGRVSTKQNDQTDKFTSLLPR